MRILQKGSSINEAWGNAKRGAPLVGEEAVNVENPQNSFDAKV